MSRKISGFLIDDAIEAVFVQKKTLVETAKIVGVTADVLSKHIRARGLIIPQQTGAGHNRKKLPDQDIIADYLGGMSEKAVAEKYNISRPAIRKRLLERGVEPRGRSAANYLKMSAMSFEQRQQQAKAANDKLRGAKQPTEGRIKRAIGVEAKPYEKMIGYGEKEFRELLTERGIDFTWQKAFHIYSIDFLIGNVAVEPTCVWSNIQRHVTCGRIKYLRERGIITLSIQIDGAADLIGNFDYIIAHVDRLNREPSPLGEYWVIRSRFEDFTRTHNELGQFTCVKTTPKLFASCRKFNY